MPGSASRIAILVERFFPRIPQPRLDLEQYTTPGDLAAWISVNASLQLGGLEDMRVADLGSGTCRLLAAFLLAGACCAVGVEADARLIELCQRGLRNLGIEERVLLVNSYLTPTSGPLRPGAVDIVVTNPPFGVWNKGADRRILLYALSLRPRRIYAILKHGNIHFFQRLGKKTGYRAEVMRTYMFPIPASMPKHRSRIRRVMVDVVEFAIQE